MRTYRDLDLEITEPERDDAGIESLRVRVAASPAGEQRRADAVRVTLGADLRDRCGRLDRRELDLDGLLELGRALGDLLLPAPARGYFERSLAALGEDEGLRLRLKLDTWGVADLPWEYAWLPPGGAADQPADASGFLALDPRISIVRYELLSEPLARLEATGARQLRLVALFAAPKDPRWAPLDLEGEERGLRAALARRREIGLEVVEPATLAGLERALLEGAQVFHFAGHGRFQAGIEDPIDTVAGRGFLVFCDAEGKAHEVPAETVVVNLHGRGVRLAVLGACEGARRDRFNPWTGIAPALVRGGLPAAVAMQATLYDRSAVAFSTRFYEALALGFPIDAAVSAGRIAIFNQSGPGERDWGVPVLYLRAESGVLFPKPAEGTAARGLAEPLGWRGWLNAGLSALALAALVAAFYAYVQPRFAERWLWGGGLSLAAVGGAALAWLHWIAGEEARGWVRGGLRRARTTAVVAAAALALVALAAFLVATRPVVLRVVPGTKLAAHLTREGAAPFSLHIWQGDADGEPTWRVEPLLQEGAVLGTSERAARLALGRSRESLEETMRSYLATNDVPEAQHDRWMERWRPAEPRPAEEGATARRRGRPPPYVVLLRGDQPIAIQPIEVYRLEEGDDHVELVFVEPKDHL
ncbi:MAG TPA: CHAT domain-containing protein [Thermoanaerobaculia bacterium]|nr:CHAT domain-containing protein [Thermoanaerobaculia bacterium]